MKNITALLTIAAFTTLSGLAIAASPAAPGVGAGANPSHIASTAPESATPLKAKAAGAGEKAKAPSHAKSMGAPSTTHSTEMKK